MEGVPRNKLSEAYDRIAQVNQQMGTPMGGREDFPLSQRRATVLPPAGVEAPESPVDPPSPERPSPSLDLESLPQPIFIEESKLPFSLINLDHRMVYGKLGNVPIPEAVWKDLLALCLNLSKLHQEAQLLDYANQLGLRVVTNEPNEDVLQVPAEETPKPVQEGHEV